MKKITLTSLAVWWLTRQLQKDSGLWIAYKANIAMAFYNEFKKQYGKLYADHIDILQTSNTAAENFLKLWTGKNEHDNR